MQLSCLSLAGHQKLVEGEFCYFKVELFAFDLKDSLFHSSLFQAASELKQQSKPEETMWRKWPLDPQENFFK